jgi:hypothetical protein
MPKPKREAVSAYMRVNAIVPTALVAKMDELRARLRQQRLPVPSYSSLVEIALRELLDQRDPTVTVRKHGAKARRDPYAIGNVNAPGSR